jgi:hypothetical protein
MKPIAHLVLISLALVINPGVYAASKKSARAEDVQPKDTQGRIEAAVTSRVEAFFKSPARFVGSAGVTVAIVKVRITRTELIPGWNGRYRSSGVADLRLAGGRLAEQDKNQTRSFDAEVIVKDDGSVEVTDVTS